MDCLRPGTRTGVSHPDEPGAVPRHLPLHRHQALLTTGKAVAIYGAVLLLTLLIGKWEDSAQRGHLQPVIFLLLVGASRSLGWLWLAGRTAAAPTGC